MADILIPFSGVTIPTPAPYDDKNPHQQRENLAFVALQIIQSLQASSFTLTFPENSTVSANLETLLAQIAQAISDLKYNSQTIEWGNIRIHLDNEMIEEFS